MKFVVHRTSDWSGKEKPCEEAEKEIYVDVNGFAESRYTVEIDTLEQLIDFCKKYGNWLVIHHNYFLDEYMEIEIYDDYRE